MDTNDNRVTPDAACPKCGEANADSLVWITDEIVACATCKNEYQPLDTDALVSALFSGDDPEGRFSALLDRAIRVDSQTLEPIETILGDLTQRRNPDAEDRQFATRLLCLEVGSTVEIPMGEEPWRYTRLA